ncbi:hypothetical protein BS47DRAFT_1338127 [Hydnum rufescens UP504]|uniref:SCA7 domain-containing protein n=1 Tax=Hydnum rufescens UP504 TaxID=1448309 RepID=A0A9P6B7I6_9AGAM|nr:hypothetical protein BS47DRAFT_1338127 [Hydnum rufescens UP504]
MSTDKIVFSTLCCFSDTPSTSAWYIHSAPIDVDKQCGVFDDKKNAICTRSITCKVHSMLAKRALPGRSKPYDELLLDWRRANDPKFVEPVPKPPRVPKKEAKERKERERLEKRAADIAAGLIDPNAPFVTPKKKKSKKVPGANGVTGSNAGPGGAGPAEYDSEDGKDLDSDVEVDALINSVHRSRVAFYPYSSANVNSSTRNSRPIPPSATQAQGQAPAGAPVGGPSPLARPQNATNFFVARNEVLRCCADILVKALQKPVGGANTSNGPGTMGAGGGNNGTSGGGLGAGAPSW